MLDKISQMIGKIALTPKLQIPALRDTIAYVDRYLKSKENPAPLLDFYLFDGLKSPEFQAESNRVKLTFDFFNESDVEYAAVEILDENDNVFATVTPHSLQIVNIAALKTHRLRAKIPGSIGVFRVRVFPLPM